MNKYPTDEKIDAMIARVLADAKIAEAETDRIADSPDLWWAIRREISGKAPTAKRPWPPKFWLLPGLAASVVMAALLVGFNFVSSPVASSGTGEVAGLESSAEQIKESAKTVLSDGKPMEISTSRADPERINTPAKRTVTVSTKRSEPLRPTRAVASRGNTTVERVKSDFIALSLASAPSSGQIVKLRVPRTMMASLGLVDSVPKGNSMVDAEVLMGDDGTTHSIRFIR